MIMLCMGCNNKNLSKKKIIILSLIIIAAALILYYSFTTSTAITLTVLPFVLPFLGCIVMCGVMAGAMFLSGRFSKKSDKSHNSCAIESPETSNPTIKQETDRDNKKELR